MALPALELLRLDRILIGSYGKIPFLRIPTEGSLLSLPSHQESSRERKNIIHGRVGKRGTSFPGRELIFHRARRVVKQFTCLLGQVFTHCSAIRNPSFVVISTLSFPTFPFKRICSCIPTLPSRKFAQTKELHSWEGRKARNELSGEGVDLLSNSSRREAIYSSRRTGFHSLLGYSQSFVVISTLSFPTFPFKRICSCIPTLPSRKFVRTKELHSWEGRKARNELSGEGVDLPSNSSRREAIYLSPRPGFHSLLGYSQSFVVISTPSFPTFPFKRICSCIPYPPIKKVRANERTSSMGGSESEERAFRGVRRFHL